MQGGQRDQMERLREQEEEEKKKRNQLTTFLYVRCNIQLMSISHTAAFNSFYGIGCGGMTCLWSDGWMVDRAAVYSILALSQCWCGGRLVSRSSTKSRNHPSTLTVTLSECMMLAAMLLLRSDISSQINNQPE